MAGAGDARECVPQRRPRILFLSHPRTGSVLLMRMLSCQPKVTQGSYFMVDTMQMMIENNDAQINPDDERRSWFPRLQQAFDQMLHFLEAFDRGEDLFKPLNKTRHVPPASGGQIIMLKEHIVTIWDPTLEIQPSQDGGTFKTWTLGPEGTESPNPPKTNPTMFPDEFLDSWDPILLIRHPALTFPSFYRASKCGHDSKVTDRWVAQGNSYRKDRALYDWYRLRFLSQLPKTQSSRHSLRHDLPLVIDMQDMVHSPAVLERLCTALGLDPSRLRYEWSAAPDQYVKKIPTQIRAYTGTIHASSSVLNTKAPREVNIDDEFGKWEEEWGSTDASILRLQVEAAMDDYDYLFSKRLQ